MLLSLKEKFLTLEINGDFKSKFELFDSVNSIGLEMTKTSKKGLLLDLLNTSSPRDILESFKTGLQISFPALRTIYIAYLPELTQEDSFSFIGMTSKGFDDKEKAISWLDDRV